MKVCCVKKEIHCSLIMKLSPLYAKKRHLNGSEVLEIRFA